MKQTNNAIKFLMAQYRAIFKNAYFKGLTSAVLLTAGLAVAGNAQASAFTNANNELADAEQEITISDQSSDSDNFKLNLSSGSAWNATVNITSGAAGGTGNFIALGSSASSDVTLSGQGSLNIDIADDSSLATKGLLVQATNASKDITLDIKSVSVLQGALLANDKSGSNSGAVTIAADTINIGGNGIDETSGATGIVILSATGGDTSTGIILGRANAAGETGLVESTINVNKGGALVLSTSAANDKITIEGAALNVAAQGLISTSGSNGTSTIGTTRTLIEADGGLVVNGPTTITSHETTINGNLLVSGGSLTVNPTAKDTNNDKDLEAGTLTIGNGANVQIGNGIIKLEDATAEPHGKMIVEDGASIVATVDATNTSGSIHIEGGKDVNSAANYTNKGPSLTISSTTLQSFLNNDGETKYNALTYNDTNNTLTEADAETLTSAHKGAILLQSGGVLNFSDTERVTLNDFYFQSGTSVSTAGTITIGDKGGIVTGDSIVITKGLEKSSDAGVDDALKLYIETNNLTLGSNTYSGTTSLGFEQARVKDNLTLVGENGTFTLADQVILKRDFFVKQTDANGNPTTTNTTTLNPTVGVIDGSNIVLSGSATNSELISVEGGAWTTDSNITITKGTLNVEAAAASGPQADAAPFQRQSRIRRRPPWRSPAPTSARSRPPLRRHPPPR